MSDRQSLYRRFHGRNPVARRVDCPVPDPTKPLVAIGRITRINYQPYGSSTRQDVEFTHESGDTGSGVRKDKPILATDGTNFFIIPDKARQKFTARGIIG